MAAWPTVTLHPVPPVGSGSGIPTASPIVMFAGLSAVIRMMTGAFWPVMNVWNVASGVAPRAMLPMNVSVVNSDDGVVAELLSQLASEIADRRQSARASALGRT